MKLFDFILQKTFLFLTKDYIKKHILINRLKLFSSFDRNEKVN